MSTTAPQPATTPMPVQLSEHEFTAFLLPHLAMPKRGPKCQLGSHQVFNLILWVLYTGMQWKWLPMPKATQGKPEIHDANVYRACATWADDGALWQAFVASVRHRAAEKHLDRSILHGDLTDTVAKKGAMTSALPATSTTRAICVPVAVRQTLWTLGRAWGSGVSGCLAGLARGARMRKNALRTGILYAIVEGSACFGSRHPR